MNPRRVELKPAQGCQVRPVRCRCWADRLCSLRQGRLRSWLDWSLALGVVAAVYVWVPEV